MNTAAPHRVRVPSPLRSYTQGQAGVTAAGATVRELLAALEDAHPGMRFRMIDEQDRIRPHIRIFVGRDEVRHIDSALAPGDEVHLVCALSGG